MRNLLLGSAAVWIGYALAVTTPALADQITQSDSLNLDSGVIAAGSPTNSVGASLPFTGFNSALGTLTGISISVLSSADSITGNLSFTSLANGDYFALYAGWFIEYAFIEGGPAGVLAAITPPSGGDLDCTPASAPNAGSCTAGPSSFSGAGAPTLSDANLSFYESPFTLNAGLGFGAGSASAYLFNTVTHTSSLAAPGTTTINTATIDAKWTGTVQVTYTYTPPAGSPGPSVPEPASIALFGSALGLLGLMARHRHRPRAG